MPTFSCIIFFFFQAEDGIRDYKVTGVQTCALPISIDRWRPYSRTSTATPAPDASGAGCRSSAAAGGSSGFAVFLDVEAHLALGALAALVGLLPVLGLDLGSLERVVHGHGVRGVGAADGHVRHHDVGQGDLGELDLRAAGLAQRDVDLAQVLARGAVLEQDRKSTRLNSSHL